MSQVQTNTLTLQTPLSLALRNQNGDFMAKVTASLAAYDINPDIFRDAVTFELNAQPKLAQCTWGSFLQSLRAAAQMGLVPGKLGGKCYLIPYKTECQFQLSYKGIIEIFGRHKIRVRPVIVRENDIFKYNFGSGNIDNHEVVDWNDRGDIKLIYVVYTFPDGSIQVNEPMTKEQIDKIRDNHSIAYDWGKAKKDSIWHKHYDIMAIKTAIKYSSKFIQVPHDVAQALALDDLSDSKKNAINAAFTHVETPSFAAALEDTPSDTVQTTIADEPEFEINPDAAAQADKFNI